MRPDRMRERLRGDRRGTIGIGTLIVFIAMVLVAAIAAAIIIKTAGELQQRAEQTGTDAARDATGGIWVEETIGHIMSTPGGNVVANVSFIVTISAGSQGFNMEKVLILVSEPYVYNITWSPTPQQMHFTYEDIVSESGVNNTHLDRQDIGRITLYFPWPYILPGQSVIFKLIPQMGPTTIEGFSVPFALPGDGQTISLI